ncbi:MAG: hypothetical protein C4617_02830 [Candidatus Liberibacter europaeus]|uniref:Uncharacterized protein n=1 Tax=Candidatus Liberibacter europaeus TaxID=744859 RepID=A0A2T4VYA4_9HYPH|nr:hypothetical protein [Candidatus Liberibacter europaeus]PTL86757.1 MAG: hypothetical protein C4617_02830 [Candidatus Liberibacter europaeus]
MENKRYFLKQRDDYDQKRSFYSSSKSVDYAVKIFSDKLVDGFLKDKSFFDGLEQELIASLRNLGNRKQKSDVYTKITDRADLSDMSLSNSKKYFGFSDSNHNLRANSTSSISDKNDIISDVDKKCTPVDPISEKRSSTGYVPLNTLPGNDLLSSPLSIKNTSEINNIALDSNVSDDFMDGAGTCQSDSSQHIGAKDSKHRILNSKLPKNNADTDHYTLGFSDKLNKCETVSSFTTNKEEKNIYQDSSEDIFLKPKKNITNLDIESSNRLPINGLNLSKNNLKKLESNYDNDVDNDFELDIGDIEKELLSVVHPKNVSSSAFQDTKVHKDKISSANRDVEKDNSFFDLNKITDFEESLELLNDVNMPVPSLIDEEKLCHENVDNSFGQGESASFFANKSQATNQAVSSTENDFLQGYGGKDNNLLSSNDVSFVEDNKSQTKSSTIENQFEQDPARNKRLWLKGYIIVVIGYGIYWFFQLHQEMNYYSGDPQIITAIKEPVQIVPDISAEQDAAAINQANEVYDRFLGKKQPSPKQAKLLDLKEVPIDFPIQYKVGNGNERGDIKGNSNNIQDENQTVVISADKDFSSKNYR